MRWRNGMTFLLVLSVWLTASPSRAVVHSKVGCEAQLLSISDAVDWSKPELKRPVEMKQVWQAHLSSLFWPDWFEALAQMKHLQAVVDSSQGPQKKYMEKIYRAAWAALTRHQRVYVEAKDSTHLDFKRHLAILRRIAGFDPAKPLFSMYQIKRTIEGRYSLVEYANCIQ